MRAFILKLLDSTDRTADTLALGILLGFLSFTALLWAFFAAFMASVFFPKLFHVDMGQFAIAMGGMGAAYSGVLTATAGAYRIRKPVEATKEPDK